MHTSGHCVTRQRGATSPRPSYMAAQLPAPPHRPEGVDCPGLPGGRLRPDAQLHGAERGGSVAAGALRLNPPACPCPTALDGAGRVAVFLFFPSEQSVRLLLPWSLLLAFSTPTLTSPSWPTSLLECQGRRVGTTHETPPYPKSWCLRRVPAQSIRSQGCRHPSLKPSSDPTCCRDRH